MSLPTTREELKNFCLRKLGDPVIQINVSEQQVEDRIDEAIQFFQQYHLDGVERAYIAHQVTATSLTFASATTSTFFAGQIITGQTSGATAKVIDQAANNLSIRVIILTGEFDNGEVISVGSSTATLAASNAVTLGDIDKGYITVSDAVYSVIRIFPLGIGRDSTNMFSYRFQSMYAAGMDVRYMDTVGYVLTQQYFNTLSNILEGETRLRFNRFQNRVHIDMNWKNEILADQFICLEATICLDPETWSEVYSDLFVREYATALIKLQWGSNTKKFAGIQMPGGVTLDGQKIFDEAEAELARLREKMHNENTPPPCFFVG